VRGGIGRDPSTAAAAESSRLRGGRGFGENDRVTVRCHRCGKELVAERIGVREVCAGCGAWLHCCRNCTLYAPGAARDCREPAAERVAGKEQGNFCDWFRPAAPSAAAPDAGASRARADLARLFGKKP
jgi:hypothetical protein